MKRVLQLMGVLMIVISVRNLLNSQWLFFFMNAALGIGFLIDPERSRAARRLRGTLMFIVFVLAVIGLTNLLMR